MGHGTTSGRTTGAEVRTASPEAQSARPQTMRVTYVLNNYTVGAKLRTAPRENIVSQTRVDRNHTEIVFEVNQRQIDFLNRLFGKRGRTNE